MNWMMKSCRIVGHRYTGIVCAYCGRLDNDTPDSWDSKAEYADARVVFEQEYYISLRKKFLIHCLSLSDCNYA